MKKALCIIAILLAICLLCSSTFFAEEAVAENDLTAEYALSDLAAGEEVSEDSYQVYDGGERILEVQHVDDFGKTAALSETTESGYYTAMFLLPDTNKEVYLTGLTRDNVNEIEQAVVSSYSAGTDFELTNLGFIDTEKTLEDDEDDYLCWAASTANILTYTGWAAQAGFTSEDDLFELFINSFVNDGSHAYYGVGWFFNGKIQIQSNLAQPLDFPNSGGYLTDYSFIDYVDVVDLDTDSAVGLRTLFNSLRHGCGVTLNLDIYQGSEDLGGHAVTLWGFVLDDDYPETDQAHYDSILVTDSDSDEIYGERRSAKDVMGLYALSSYQSGDYDYYSFDITATLTAYLTDSLILQPYSEELSKETSTKASRNRLAHPDMAIYQCFLTDATEKEEVRQLFKKGTQIRIRPYFINYGNVTYSGTCNYKLTVTDKNGTQVSSRTVNNGNYSLEPKYYFWFNFESLGSNLGVGDYTVTIDFNPNRTVNEAYYYNNVYSLNFKVRQSYLVGDIDDSGDVSAIDAVWIQRVNVGMEVNLDEYAELRGDVDGDGYASILDATMIQRNLVGMIDSDVIATSRNY